MENLPKDVLIFMALEYGLDTIYKLCQTNKKFNNIICKNNIFWMNKVEHDYGKFGHIPEMITKNYGKIHDWKKYYQILNYIQRNNSNLNKLLYSASKNNQKDLVKFLLADNRTDLKNPRSLMVASSKGNINIVKLLLKHGKFNPMDYGKIGNMNTNSVLLASLNGHLDVVKLLFDKNLVDPSIYNKVLENAIDGCHTNMVNMLLDDYNVDPAGNNNYAIIIASVKNCLSIVKLLLKCNNVDPSVHDNEPIKIASIFRYIDIVKLLLQDPRVDPSVDNNKLLKSALYNSQPLHPKHIQHHLSQKEYDDNKKIATMLLNNPRVRAQLNIAQENINDFIFTKF